jgi:hypothetical protein
VGRSNLFSRVEVGDLRGRAAVVQDLQLVLVQPELALDEPRGVGVDDRPIGPPDLDPLDVLHHQQVVDPVEAVERAGVGVDEPPRQCRLGDRVGQQLGGGAGAGEHLVRGGPTTELTGADHDDAEREQPGEQHQRHRVAQPLAQGTHKSTSQS